MKYGARKFDQKSYNHSDKFAKDLFSTFIKKRNHTIQKIEEDYNHDLITEKDGKTYYFELETKSRYPFTDRESFPFNSVSFLGRKERLHNLQPFYYIIICRETEVAAMAYSEDIYKEEYKENLSINTRNRQGKDQMFRLPKEKCWFFDLNK